MDRLPIILAPVFWGLHLAESSSDQSNWNRLKKKSLVWFPLTNIYFNHVTSGLSLSDSARYLPCPMSQHKQRPKGGKSRRQRICFMKASLSLAKLALSRRLTRRIPEVESGDPKIIPKISLFFVMFDGEPIVLGSFMFRKPPGVHEICWRCWKRGRLQTRWDPDLLFRLFFSIFSGSLLCLTSPKRTKTRGLPNEIGPSNPAKPAHLPFFGVWRDMIWHVHDMFIHVLCLPYSPLAHVTAWGLSCCAEADFLGAPEESRSSFDVGLLGGPKKSGCKI